MNPSAMNSPVSSELQSIANTSHSADLHTINWWHQIALPDGVITPGRDRTFQKLQRLQMPADLTGKTVLDIGAWDGAFSFEAERRGASRVVALDSTAYRDAGWEGFDYAKKALGSRVEKLDMPLDQLSRERVGEFDLVLFLGILYHLPNPLLVLDAIADVTRELLILETQTDMTLTRRPAAAFYPDRELNDDASNWFGPNVPAVEGMLQVAGFRSVRTVWRTSFFRTLAASIRSRHPFARLQQGRCVVHASR
jgi:tRNA (mo5U34)-methyltransferase